MGTPLPPNPYDLRQPTHAAYDFALYAEKQASLTSDTDGLLNSRVAGYTILHVPDHRSIIREISENPTPEGVYKVGFKYLDFFVKPFRKERERGEQIPTPSEISTPLYIQTEVASRELVLVPSPDHKTTKRYALIRDGLKCMLTGKYDKTEVMKSKALAAKVKAKGEKPERTNCAHIFPTSLNPSNHLKKEYAVTVWQVLKMVGGLSKELVDSLNGPGINQLGNVLTVNSEDRDSIDMLWLWLEKLEAPDNTYKICSGSESLVPRPNVVTFSTDTSFPLPRSDLLAVHAAACRVAHLSGAAEYLRMREEEDNEEVPAVWASETEFAAVLQKKLERVQRVLSVH